MAIDISGLSYFMPVYTGIFIFVLLFAVLTKTKILGDSKAVNVIISLVIAIIFSTFSGAREYIQSVTPWFAVLLVAVFLILLLVGLGTGKTDMIKPWFIWIFIIILILILVTSLGTVSAFFRDFWGNLGKFVTEGGRVAGTVIFAIIAAIVIWIVVKK